MLLQECLRLVHHKISLVIVPLWMQLILLSRFFYLMSRFLFAVTFFIRCHATAAAPLE